jgi:hypothetical protein
MVPRNREVNEAAGMIYPAAWLARILSIFSFSVCAVKGLTT